MASVNFDTYVWTAEQLMAVRAIRLIERKLQPKCDSCGSGADRPNCAMDMGGHCRRHEQEDVTAYQSVIRSLEVAAGLTTMWSWRSHYPLDQIHKLSDDDKALMHDLYDLYVDGKNHLTRKRDDRFDHLSSIGVVYYSASDRWQVTFTKRGLVWAIKLFGEQNDK